MVYSVRKGNVKKIGELFFSGAGLGDVVYYSPSEKAIYHQWLTHGVGGVGMALYRISGNNLKTVRYAWEGYPNGKHEFYLANDKKVSEKTLKAYVNKYFGTRLSKLKQYKMLKNTVANRNKIK